ncbi:MAG: hypothetical protein IPK32_10460 [Verrucomicrobiaceae bacterium]|nr:hypothetical protein [Verrucomicrobiaceae bacterium]
MLTRSTTRIMTTLLFVAVSSLRAQNVAEIALENRELHTTLAVAAEKIKTLESTAAAAKAKSDALAQSAAAANQEAAELKDRYEKLRGLLEGLGIGALENSKDQSQERLLAALSDLRIIKQQRDELAGSLMEVAEASVALARSAPNADPAAADKLNKTLTNADGLLSKIGGTAPADGAAAGDLQNARVVSMKPELGIAVINLGRKDGVKPGMPFEIYREDKPIAKVLITEVRSTVAGAVVQELANPADPVRVGDAGRAEITARQF